MVHDYPEPPEEKTKEVRARITITYIVEGEVPEEWETSEIEDDIKHYKEEYDIVNEYVEDVEVL